jgi:HSP20 family molecular chaperone IbpA
MKLQTTPAKTLLDELQRTHKHIAERAYEIFRSRGAAIGAALDDWLAAERLSVWKPAVEMTEKDNALVIEAAVAGVDPSAIDVQVTPDTLLIKADVTHRHHDDREKVHICEFQPGQLFRAIPLPKEVNADAVVATYRNGLLTVTAPIAAASRPHPVEVRVA